MKCIVEETPKDKYYPVLKKSTLVYGLIVMFTSEKKGVVVNPPESSCFSLGYFSDTWVEDSFQKFDGSVTLSNT